jgi:hypothetical protein
MCTARTSDTHTDQRPPLITQGAEREKLYEELKNFMPAGGEAEAEPKDGDAPADGK